MADVRDFQATAPVETVPNADTTHQPSENLMQESVKSRILDYLKEEFSRSGDPDRLLGLASHTSHTSAIAE